MKPNFVNVAIFTVLLILISVNLVDGTTDNESNNNSTFFNMDFSRDVTLVILGAALAVVTGYASERLKLKSKPRKQLSYEILTKKDLVEVEEKIRDNVKIIYNGQTIENLYYIAFDLENNGSSVIKNQYLRFEFPERTKIIDSFFEPSPEPEVGIEKIINDSKLKDNELKYKIRHLERGQRLGYRFILTSDNPLVTPKIHPYNEEGDVILVPKSINKSHEEKDDIISFITLYLYLLLIPTIFTILPSEIEGLATGLIRLVILIYILPFVKPFAKAIGEIVSRINAPKMVNCQSEMSINNLNISNEFHDNDSKVR